jgi:hypothetical protein
LEDAGLPVDEVNIVFLPTAGDLRDVIYWSAPYDRSIAERALHRATEVRRLGRALGYAEVAEMSGTADDFCTHCPWFSPHRPDPIDGRCPGSLPVVAELALAKTRKPEAW